MNDSEAGISPFEQEWRTCVTVIQAAAEILRDYGDLAEIERGRFLEAIIEGNRRLTRTFGIQCSGRFPGRPTHGS